MKTTFRINLIFTAVTTLLSLLLYGLLLAIPLGAFQLIYFIVVISNKNINKEGMDTHLIAYGLLAFADLVFFFTTMAMDHLSFFLGPIIGVAIAWYHVWISSALAKTQANAIQRVATT